MADTSGLAVTFDELSADDGETIKEWREPIVQSVDAALLGSDRQILSMMLIREVKGESVYSIDKRAGQPRLAKREQRKNDLLWLFTSSV